MTSIRTLTQLQQALDEEMSWRIKEIYDLKTASNSRRVFVRAGVAIVYAHWEGFIKNSSMVYLSYIENQRCTYRELKSCFAAIGLKQKLDLLSASRQSSKNIEAFDFVLGSLDNVARLPLSNAVDTESNLTSKVFSNIAVSLGVDLSSYNTRFNLIDERLVNRRNKIAHGEYLEIDSRDFRLLADDILQIMRDYKTDLQNAASLQEYYRDNI